MVLIDSGDGTDPSMEELSAKLKDLGIELQDISMIINTHEHIEHFGGNSAIKDISGARILSHRLAVPLIEDMKKQVPSEQELKGLPEEISFYIKTRSMLYGGLKTSKVDVHLKDNDLIRIDDYALRVIYTPGHTKGHICIYEEEDGILFAGDMIRGKGTPYVGALPGQYGDMADFLNSLHRLEDLKIKRLLQSHGNEVEDAHKKIEDTIQSKLARENELLIVLEKGEKTVTQLLNIIYGESTLAYYTYGTVLAYLRKIEREGRVKQDGEYWKLL